MLRWFKAFAVGVLVAIIGVLIGLSSPGASLEQGVGLGWLFGLRGSIEPPREAVVVAIDSRTGAQLGFPPLPRDWPRAIHGRLVDELTRRGAAVIVFDIHFGRAKDPQSDGEFVAAVERSGRVLLVELLTGKRQPISDQSGRHVGMVWTEESVPPFDGLADAGSALATFPLPKEGAAVHQFWVFKESTDNAATLPATALQMYLDHELAGLVEHIASYVPEDVAQLPDVARALEDANVRRNLMRGLREIYERHPELRAIDQLPNTPIGLTPRGIDRLKAMYAGDAHRFLNFYGPPGTILNVPYHAVIKGSDPNVPPEALDFTGKVVFVGSSDLYDPGQPDRFYTVFTRDDGVDLAGVEIAATGFANLLTNRSIQPISGWNALAMLVAFGLVAGLFVYGLPAIAGVPIVFGMAILYAVMAQIAFNDSAVLWPIATPIMVQFPVALFIGLLGQYLLERERGQRISEAINYYLPDDIARDLTRSAVSEERINKVVYSTCFATDMAGFSTVSEQLSPGELAKYLNDYFETLAAPLKRHGVQVTEFRADAIMCAWTADEPSEEPRRKAVLAALEAGEAIKGFKQRHPDAEGKLRIGLEAGEVYVGHAGGGGRFVYSIVGDSANTASRIEGLNKHVGTQILATGEVIEGFDDLFMRYLGDFVFVGKTEGLPVYEIMATEAEATGEQRALRDLFDEAMAAYRQADWPAAQAGLNRLLQIFPDDGPAKFFLARCERFIAAPDADGDTVLVRMDQK